MEALVGEIALEAGKGCTQADVSTWPPMEELFESRDTCPCFCTCQACFFGLTVVFA